MDAIKPQQVEAHLRKLTLDIGVRLAGSRNERRAADYVADRFDALGATVSVEEFPVRERRVEAQDLGVSIGGRWIQFPCSLFSNTPGTDGKTVEAPLVFFDPNTDYSRPDLSFLKEKAVVHLGTHVESRELYRRLMEANPAFLLFVDVRYPGTTPLADGLFPAYVKTLGAVPVMSVAFMDAWRWKTEGAAAAKLRVAGGMYPAFSQNVIAEFQSADHDGAILFAGAHHDTQADSVGADDNGTGVAGVIELARGLAKAPRKRTVRLISFGAEEQLSVGSAAYVHRHRAELRERGRFMFNLDAFGSRLGWTTVSCAGSDEMAGFIKSVFAARGNWIKTVSEVTPYADHFPFVAAGVPGVWLGRDNCLAGRFFHHRPDDDLSRVSTPLVASLLDSVVDVIGRLAVAEPMPFPGGLDEASACAAQTMWEDLFGGWQDE